MNRRLKEYVSKLACIHHPKQRRRKGGVGEVISRVRPHHIIIPEPGKPEPEKQGEEGFKDLPEIPDERERTTSLTSRDVDPALVSTQSRKW